MRKLAIALALASTAITSPALARDDSWYVGVEGGASIVEDADIDISNATTGATIGSGRTEVGRVDLRQPAVAAPDWRTHRVDDVGLGHVVTPSVS